MIQLREDSDITVGEFVQKLKDLYHTYFPNSKIDIICSNGTIEINPYLGNTFKRDIFHDDSGIEITLYRDTQNASNQSDSPVGTLIFTIVGGYSFSRRPCIQDYNAGWYEEIKDIDTDIDDDIDPETFIEWFDDFCSKLYKATRKMWRHGHISKEYEEFIS